MTNEEKASLMSARLMDGSCMNMLTYDEVKETLAEMAEWKDARFEEYLEKKTEADAAAEKIRKVLNGADVIERWESEEVLNALRVALNTEYGLTGLDSQREIDEKIAKTPETCLMRMLKSSIEIISKIVK